MGFLLEVGLGLLAAHEKTQKIANPDEWNPEKMLKELKKNGLNSTPVFYTPDGDRIGEAFYGPIYYLLLNHFA